MAGRDPGGGRHRFPPVRKSLGQHFLSDRAILGRIVDALAPGEGETVVEIGPGRGAMTERLLDRPGIGRLVAVEYDRALAAALQARYATDRRVHIIQADVLDLDLGAVAGGPYALIGNVPYYITTPILFHALRRPRADRCVFLVQREVAERMAAVPGTKAYGALSVNLQAVAHPELLFRVPAGAFSPPPKVDSTVVRVTPLTEPIVSAEEEQGFRELVQSAFGMRRKQMRRVLRGILPMTAEAADDLLRETGIDPVLRPESLSPARFAALYRRLSS